MLESTFCCFKGVSESAEQRIWQSGILTWQQFLKCSCSPLSIRKTEQIKIQIHEAQIALKAGLVDYFLQRLPIRCYIRVLQNFYNCTGFLDIETTGLTKKDTITVIGLKFEKYTYCFVEGDNLSEFLKILPSLGLIITFNGCRFDLPMIRRKYHIDINCAHIDMMQVMNKFGYKGGQKSIESRIGFKRKNSKGCTGKDAVNLWNVYQKEGSQEALKLLIQYNKEDVQALEYISIWAYNQSVSSFPISMKL